MIERNIGRTFAGGDAERKQFRRTLICLVVRCRTDRAHHRGRNPADGARYAGSTQRALHGLDYERRAL